MKDQTILVVDDEGAIRRVLMRVLRKAGYQVETADSVFSAEHIMDHTDVQLIICDQNMPGELGISFLTRLKTSHPDIVRVLFTSEKDVNVAMDAVNQAQVHRFVTKPIHPMKVIEAVNELLQWATERPDTAVESAPPSWTDRQDTDVVMPEERSDTLEQLAALHPGIDEVTRDASGAIILDDSYDASPIFSESVEPSFWG